MSSCKHTQWLRLRQTTGRPALEVSDRPNRLLEEIPHADDPVGFAVLIGNQTKSLVLSNMCPRSKCSKGQRHHGEVHLHVSHVRATKPSIIADADVPSHNRLPTSSSSYRCHETTEHPIPEGTPMPRAVEAADEIYQSQLFPFVDVVCLFVADIGGTDSAVQRLAAWSAGARTSSPPSSPVLILVVSRGEKKRMQAAVDSMTQHGDSTGLTRRFQHISIVALTPTRRSAWQTRELMFLRRRLFQAIDTAQKDRHGAGILFSARHTTAFLRAATDGVALPRREVNLIEVSRRSNPVAPDLSTHLTNFLKCFDDSAALEQVAIPEAASSLIVDQYPPGMHHFHPGDSFDALYRDACTQAAESLEAFRETSGLPQLPFSLVQLMRDRMVDQFRQFQQLGTAKEQHLRQLARTRQVWVAPSSEETCFFCMRRRPQHYLPCSHWTCQTCVRIFGRRDDRDPWLFHIGECLLCGVALDFSLRVRPVTATTRVLSIDGGGTRGRAPLEFLQALQDTVALPYPVQQNFDVIFGTSSGAMIACALCINGWPVQECTEYFQTSSRLAFEKRRSFQVVESLLGNLPIVVPAIQFVVSLLVDSKYSADKLEAIQQDACGLDRSIVDSRHANSTGAMVGVTLTRTDDTSTFIVTNYNGAGNRRDHPEYDILRFEKGAAAVPLWEVLRCCTAAPYYFTAHRLKGSGTFQDGGLTFNNPVSIAIKEAAALFPAAPEPSVVVSLGTGSASPGQPADSLIVGTWKESFPARLYRSFWKQGDSSAAWDHVMSYQKDQTRGEYFRLDVRFEAEPPALDDVDGMGRVAEVARDTASGSAEVERLARCLRAELFVFELDGSQQPRVRNGVYRCVGHISCRLRAGTDEYETLMRQLAQRSASFQCQEQRLRCEIPDRTCGLANFRLPVVFHVPSRQAPCRITLREGTGNDACNISGSPFTLEWLIAQQKLDATFGREDHQ